VNDDLRMANREPKSALELARLVMAEISERPELRNIQDAVVTPLPKPIPYGPTWDCAYITDGAAPARLGIADDIKRRLQGQFDLI
jgi:hypothetical protein